MIVTRPLTNTERARVLAKARKQRALEAFALDAKDHDDAVFAKPDPDDGNPGGAVICVAIAAAILTYRSGVLLTDRPSAPPQPARDDG